MRSLSAWLSLFTSTGTLLCCALPSLLVALGMGATMAGLVSSVPQLVWLSQYKLYVFSASGAMLGLASFLQYRSQFEPCPIDPEQARACTASRVWSLRVLLFAIVVWSVGFFFAFVAPLI
jgi:mercuric ion transport protein